MDLELSYTFYLGGLWNRSSDKLSSGPAVDTEGLKGLALFHQVGYLGLSK